MIDMRHFIDTVSFLSLLISLTFFANDSLQSQTRPLPIIITCRESLLKGSYVLQIQNSSNEKLNLWLQAKGKISPFILPADKMVEFGWAQGYHFDANNFFLIGGSGYDTIKQLMPNIELSPWRINFPNDGGLALSLSQSFLQDQLHRRIELPIKRNFSTVFEISINQVPQIKLIEGSDRIYANVIFQASLFSTKVYVPIVVNISCIPFYTPSTGGLGVTQIKVENIDLNVFPKEYLDATTQIVNQILPVIFTKYVIIQFQKEWLLKLAKIVNLRTKVIDGRLEIIIL